VSAEATPHHDSRVPGFQKIANLGGKIANPGGKIANPRGKIATIPVGVKLLF